MAIISYVGAQLNPANSTFQDWLNRTNEMSTDLGTVVVSIGGSNVGDVELDGVFTANSVVSSNTTTDLMTVTSELSVPSIIISLEATVNELNVDNDSNLNSLNVSGPTQAQAISAVSIDTPDLNVSANTTTTNLEVTGAAVISNGTIATLTATGNTTLDVTTASSLTVTGNTALANTSLTNLEASSVDTLNLTVSANTNLGRLSVSDDSFFANTTINNLDVLFDTNLEGNLTVSGNSTFENMVVNNFEVLGVFNIETIGITANTVFQNIEVTGNTTFGFVSADFIDVSQLEVGTIDVQDNAFFTRIESANNVFGQVTANTVNISSLTVSGSSTLSGTLSVGSDTTLSGTLSVGSNTTLADTEISNLSITGTSALRLPAGATAQRPIGVAGHIRFNQTLTQFEGFDGVQWGTIGGGSEISDDTTTNETRYVTFVSDTDGRAEDLFVSSSRLFFNPSTGSLNSTEFNSLSDITFKEDVQEITDVSEILNNINTYSFKWKETGQKSYGVLAQELEQILPELINNSNGVKYVNYTPLIAVLLEGYKKLAEKVELLEKSNK